MYVRRVEPSDRELMQRLWLLFRHDLSEFQGQLPAADGSYRSEWLEKVLTGDPEWAGHLVWLGENPIGFVLLRALQQPVHVLNAFFLVRPVRRHGHGLAAVREVLRQYPGSWEVAFQEKNTTAVAFWRRVAAELSGDGWTEEQRPIKGKPDAPWDSWISFKV